MQGQFLGFNWSKYLFNRYQDEVYILPRGTEEYMILEGLLADLVHMIFVQAMAADELEIRMNRLLFPKRVSRESLDHCVQELLAANVLTYYGTPERATVLKPDVDPVADVKSSRQKSYFYAPLTANVFINGRCNQTCRFCFLDSDLMKTEHARSLSTEKWIDLTKQLVDSGVGTVNIGGMEPTLDFDLSMAVLRQARASGAIIGMITNGTVPLTDDQLDQLAEIGCRIGISLENHEGAVHNQLTGTPTAFQKCVANIKRMIAHGIYVGIQTVATRENTHNIEDFVLWLDELGVDGFTLMNVFVGPWCEESEFWDLVMRYDEFRQLVQRLQALKSKARLDIQVTLFPHLRTPDHSAGLHKGLALRTRGVCSAGKTSVQLSPTGDVNPCPVLVGHPEHVVGNLADSLLIDIWHNDAGFGAFRKHRADQHLNSTCRNCASFELCRGGCLVTANQANGDYLNGDPRCDKVGATSARAL